MRELYDYMVKARQQMYESGKIEIDQTHFFRLYQLLCHMIQIRNIIHHHEDMESMIKEDG